MFCSVIAKLTHHDGKSKLAGDVDSSAGRFTIRGMTRRMLVLAGVMMVVGCEAPDSVYRSTSDQQMFGPASIRIHPTFTQVRDWTGDGKPDGIEATLEMLDQFGEPTRSTGTVRFELFTYRPDLPDYRGPRLVTPWVASLDSTQDQQLRWNSALRAYTFQLHYADISKDRFYVLRAQLDLVRGSPSGTTEPGRLFNQIIIPSQSGQDKDRLHYHTPTNEPGKNTN
jgi:hypothetical protein